MTIALCLFVGLVYATVGIMCAEANERLTMHVKVGKAVSVAAFLLVMVGWPLALFIRLFYKLIRWSGQ